MSLRRSATNTLAAFVFTLMLLPGRSSLSAESKVTINSDTETYDFHPASTTTSSGATWYAWHGYSHGQDRIVARRIGADSRPGERYTLSQAGSTHGPPVIVGGADDSVAVVWSRMNSGRWQVIVRRHAGGKWSEPIIVSDDSHDAIYPSAIAVDENSTMVAWSACVAGSWRVRCRRVGSDELSPIADCSPVGADAFRPVLALHDGQVWCFWDQYRNPDFTVHGRVVHPAVSPIEQASPEGEYCRTPTALSHPSGLHVAWLKKVDVMGGPGVVSQWHSLHAAVRGGAGWQQITTPDGDTTAADLTQGLMAKIEPRPVATGGYLGPRLRPSLLADGDRVWLLWERKSNHRGSTPTVSGDLVGRPSQNGVWKSPIVLKQGLVDYHPIDPPAIRDGRIRILASPLPRRGIRHYEAFEVLLAEARPFEQDEWTGWNPVSLPIERELSPRRQITCESETWKLFWADLHCHNGLWQDENGRNLALPFLALDTVRACVR